MLYARSIGVFLILLVFLIGCSGKKTHRDDVENKSESVSIPKEATSIRASIIAIDDSTRSMDKNSPCSKKPCWAEVKIEKIIGRGQNGPLFTLGDTLKVNFAFTLSETTEELIPNLEKRMPGLSIGDKFNANIRFKAELNSQNIYEVYLYTKI